MSGSPGRDQDRLGAGWLVLLLPLACCGGPVLIGALAAAGGLLWGAVGVGVAVAVGVVVVLARRRMARACHTERATARTSAPRIPTTGGRS